MKKRFKWIIVLVAFEEDDVAPQVLKERIDAKDDEQLAAFLRGGELVETINLDNEQIAEAERAHYEKTCLR